MKEKYILYDFDGTIYDGDSSVDFVLFCFKKEPKLLKYLPKIILAALKYKFKIITKKEMKEIFFSFLKDIKNVDKLLKGFWKIHEKNIKEFYKSKNHDKDIIISASPKFLLEPIAKKYKVVDLFGSPIDKKTGKYDGENCHGEEKVRLFKEKYKKAEILEMYTDSKHDLPLIKLAKKGYLVVRDDIYDYFEYKKPNFLIRLIKWSLHQYQKHEEIINYLIFGVLTTVVSLVSYYLLVLTILNPNSAIELQIANIISWILSVLFAYVTNRKYVFKSKNKEIFKELTSFCGSRVLTLLLDMGIMFFFVTLLKGNDKIFKLVSQVLIVIGNYIISKLLVFKK